MPAENHPITRSVLRSHAPSACSCSARSTVPGAGFCGSADIDSKPPSRRIAQFAPTRPYPWDGLMMIWLRKDVIAGKQALPFVFGKKTGANRVGRQLTQFPLGESLHPVRKHVFIAHIRTEKCRVVGIQRHEQPRIEVT